MTDFEFTSLCHSMMMELQRTVDNEKAPPSQSILGIMKNFIDSVNEMDETVLIPSRLMDINMDNCGSMFMDNDDSTSMSVIPTSTIASSTKEVHPVPSEQVSLHTYYSMLKAVKRELARGPVDESELSEMEDGNLDEESARLQAQTARAFREHLRGLFSILSHLTNVSKHLMTTYQQETGDHQSCLKPKSFHV